MPTLPADSPTPDDLRALALGLRRAEQLRLGGRPRDALQLLMPLLERHPQRGELWLAAGLALARTGRTIEAERAMRECTQRSPELAEGWLQLGRMASTHGRRHDARRHYAAAVERAPHAIAPLTRLAACLVSLGHLDEAEPYVARALALAPDAPPCRAVAARLAQRRGELERAWQLVEDLPPDPHVVEVAVGLALARGRPRDGLPLIQQGLAAARGDLRALFHKLAADLHDALDDTERAFHHWNEANRVRGLTFSPRHHRLAVQQLIERTAGPWPSEHHPEADRPVLIVGVPRSGTSLLEQALGCHPDIAPGGELPTLRELAIKAKGPHERDWADALPRLQGEHREAIARQYLAKLDTVDGRAPRVTDKMPNNLLQLGFLAHILPGTRVILCRRNPVDTGFSCFRQAFSPGLPWATDLNWIACWIESCAELYAAWRPTLPLRFHEVGYEDLVSDPERVLRDTLAFLDLPWDPAVLRPERLDRKVATASAFEVEEPIHPRSIGRSARYRAHLGPLLALERRSASPHRGSPGAARDAGS